MVSAMKRSSNLMKKICTGLMFFALFAQITHAQTFELGSWNILNIHYTLNDNWSLYGEGQLRSLKFYDNFHYYEYKGYVNYKFNKEFSATLGAGSYQTYREGGDFVLPKNNDEFRVWPQLQLTQSLGRFKVEQRYRSEMRFTSNGYRNRFRYRLALSYSFGSKAAGYQRFKLTASNELFFTDKQPYFERNRIACNLNYKITKSTSLMIGYLHQFDYRINDETGRDFLQIGFYIDIFRNEPTENEIQQPVIQPDQS